MFDTFVVSEARGFAGGIWVLWNSGEYTIEPIGIDAQVLNLVVQGGDGSRWILSAVYASPYLPFRNLLWKYLTELGHELELPWLLLGDFNQALVAADKLGGRRFNPTRSRHLQNMIDQCALLDIGFRGPRFTWCNMRRGDEKIQVRLNRSFCNWRWHSLFPAIEVLHLPRTSSDHIPICIRSIPSGSRSVPHPFRLLDA